MGRLLRYRLDRPLQQQLEQRKNLLEGDELSVELKRGHLGSFRPGDERMSRPLTDRIIICGVTGPLRRLCAHRLTAQRPVSVAGVAARCVTASPPRRRPRAVARLGARRATAHVVLYSVR